MLAQLKYTLKVSLVILKFSLNPESTNQSNVKVSCFWKKEKPERKIWDEYVGKNVDSWEENEIGPKKKLGCILPLVYLNGGESSMAQYTQFLPVEPSPLTYDHYEFGPLNGGVWIRPRKCVTLNHQSIRPKNHTHKTQRKCYKVNIGRKMEGF